MADSPANPSARTSTQDGRFAAHLETAFTLHYRIPKEAAVSLLPSKLEPVTRGPWAFWDVAFERITAFRPLGVPEWCGHAFTMVSQAIRAKAMLSDARVVVGRYVIAHAVDHAAAQAYEPFRRSAGSTAELNLSRCNGWIELTVNGTPFAASDMHVTFFARDGCPVGDMRHPTGSTLATPFDLIDHLQYSQHLLLPAPAGADSSAAEAVVVAVDGQSQIEHVWPAASVRAAAALLDDSPSRGAVLESAAQWSPAALRFDPPRTFHCAPGILQDGSMPPRPGATSVRTSPNPMYPADRRLMPTG